MDRSSIDTIKTSRATSYAEKGLNERAKEIATSDKYTPILNPRELHPEEEPSLNELNAFIADIAHDLTIVNKELAMAGDKFKHLMYDTTLVLSGVQKHIAIEEERLKDLNMLCGDHTGFNNVETLTSDDFDQAHTDDDLVFHSRKTSSVVTRLRVIDVKGNGYEGNEYVYRDKQFVADRLYTGDRNFLTDRSLSTFYEYSRLSTKRRTIPMPPFINLDDIGAECTITLQADAPVSMIEIFTESEDLILKEVSVSDDGSIFRPVTETSMTFNDKDNIYKDGAYIYGSGIICFPASQFIKLAFQSDSYNTDEELAFAYQEIVDIEKEEDRNGEQGGGPIVLL